MEEWGIGMGAVGTGVATRWLVGRGWQYFTTDTEHPEGRASQSCSAHSAHEHTPRTNAQHSPYTNTPQQGGT